MLKTIIGTAAVVLAAACQPALAHDWDDGDDYNGTNGYYGYDDYGYGNYGYGGHDNIAAEHVRLCREHERFHDTLNAIHEQQEEQGFYGRDRYDADRALNEAEEEFHEQHPGAGNCGYWYRRYYGSYGGY